MFDLQRRRTTLRVEKSSNKINTLNYPRRMSPLRCRKSNSLVDVSTFGDVQGHHVAKKFIISNYHFTLCDVLQWHVAIRLSYELGFDLPRHRMVPHCRKCNNKLNIQLFATCVATNLDQDESFRLSAMYPRVISQKK